MDNSNFSVNNTYTNEDTINIREIFEKYFRHWKFIVLCIAIALIIGFLYLQSRIPIYESSAMVIVSDEKSGNLSNELSVFSDLGIITQKGNLYNEIEIFKSRKLLSQVVQDLQLNISIVKEGNFLTPDKYYYNDSPINIKLSTPIENIVHHTTLELTIIDNDNFKITENYTNTNGKDISENKGKHKFGDSINTSLGFITIDKTNYLQDNNKGDDFIINISSIENAVNN